MATPQDFEEGRPVPVSATGLVQTGNGCLQKVLCNTSTSGTLTAYDALSATGTPFINAMPLVAGQDYLIDAVFQTGLFITIGGTAAITATIGP